METGEAATVESGNARAAAKGSGKRHMSREMALQMLYQVEIGGSPLREVFSSFDVLDYLGQGGGGGAANLERTLPGVPADRLLEARRAFEYACGLVHGAVERQEQIDALIRDRADNWRLERMPAVDRNILRLAVYELFWERDVPKLVVVDEAVELAKRFGSEQSGRFVNGLLDGMMKGSEGELAR